MFWAREFGNHLLKLALVFYNMRPLIAYQLSIRLSVHPSVHTLPASQASELASQASEVLMPAWLALRPDWLGLRPAWLALGPSMGGLTGGQMNLPILQNFVPHRGRCPKMDMVYWINQSPRGIWSAVPLPRFIQFSG